MRSRSIKISAILILLISVAATTFFLYAYYFQQNKKEEDKTFGDVEVRADLYFIDSSNTRYEASFKETSLGNYKIKVYSVNISNLTSFNHINNLRLDFINNSNIDTYFRMRILDTLTITYLDSSGKLVELSIPHTEPLEYSYDNNNWYHDNINDWYYFKDKVNKTNNTQTFLLNGLNYPLMPAEYEIQFGVMIEAVQSHLGPENNWNLSSKPWGGAW